MGGEDEGGDAAFVVRGIEGAIVVPAVAAIGMDLLLVWSREVVGMWLLTALEGCNGNDGL